MNKALFAVLALSAAAASAETGSAKVAGTAAGSAISGTVSFEDTSAGLKITADLHGLTPGDHAFHIHEWGSCEDSAKAAGGHFNPTKAPHGQALKDGVHKAHAGDLGNVAAGADGNATLDVTLKGASLTKGKFAVAGRAVVVHEKVDDFSQPAGNAGGRVACGVIGLVGPAASAAPAPAAPAAK